MQGMMPGPMIKTQLASLAITCLGLLPLVASPPARAQRETDPAAIPVQACPTEWLKRLRPERPKAQAQRVSQVLGSHCRSFPGDRKRQVAAISYGPPDEHRHEQNPERAWPVTLVLAVFQTQGKQVLQRYEQIIEEDPLTRIGGHNFVWDPAVYRLAPEVLALGLRFDNSGREASCPDQRWAQQFSLLLPDGAQLRPIFAAALHTQIGRDGPLCGDTPSWEEHHRLVALAPSQNKGWADLLLIDRMTLETRDRPEGQKPETRRSTMRWQFDGQHYRPAPGEPYLDLLEEAVLVKPQP